MKVLLLGANGLLGMNVLHKLYADGHRITVLVRQSSPFIRSVREFVDEGDVRCDDHVQGVAVAEDVDNVIEGQADGAEVRLRVVEGSLLNYEHLRVAAEGCEAIINCAGTTDMSLRHYADYLPVNANLCATLTHLMDELEIGTLVHVSTANTIGYGTAMQKANEESPMSAPFTRSYYACSKQRGEQLLLGYAKRNPNRHVVIINPGFIIGAYDSKPSSGALLLAAYRKPLMFAPRGGKSFVAATDVAVAVVNALDRGRSAQRYLATGVNLSLRQFYALQADRYGYKQLLITIPSFVALAAGYVGDILRWLGLSIQLSSNNVRQLLVREYYDNSLITTDLAMPHTPIEQAVDQFFAYRRRMDR